MQQSKLNDEKDKQDQTGDPNATAEYDPNMAGLDQDGKYMTAPGFKDSPDELKQNQVIHLFSVKDRVLDTKQCLTVYLA